MYVLTVEQFAAAVGRHPTTVRRLIRAGRLVAVKFGGTWMLSRDQLDLLRALAGATSGTTAGNMAVRDVATMDASEHDPTKDPR